MWRVLYLPGIYIARWDGVQVWQGNNGIFANITHNWNWSQTEHQHYEVAAYGNGSFWVPASTNPPATWGGATPIVGTYPPGPQPVNHAGIEFRPDTTYIWIPNDSIPPFIVPGVTSNRVVCGYPLSYPPRQFNFELSIAKENTMTGINMHADTMLAAVLDPPPPPKSAFQDSDGLISFVNLSSSFVEQNPEFKTGQTVCDKISNFMSTLRIKVFNAMKTGAVAPLPGDTKPATQWDSAVTHYMFFLLSEKGGLTNFSITTETYSVTQVITEFSAAFVKLIFDAAFVPEAVIGAVTSFIQGVGSALRLSWDDRSRTFHNALLGQCHEAVPIDDSGKDFRYFPKVKYYNIVINSTQTEFTSPCVDVKRITFNFDYEYYVTGLDKDLLDKNSTLYTNFIAFLDKAQQINSKDADNQLDQVLGVSSSSLSASREGVALVGGREARGLNAFGVNLAEYPRATVQPPLRIQELLNRRKAA